MHDIPLFAFKNSVIRPPVLTKKRTFKVDVAAYLLKPLLVTERNFFIIVRPSCCFNGCFSKCYSQVQFIVFNDVTNLELERFDPGNLDSMTTDSKYACCSRFVLFTIPCQVISRQTNM